MTTTKTETWTLLDKESQLYIAEDNKDADGSMDSVKRREKIYALLHEARIRRELILWSIEDDEIYISMVAVMKDITCSSQPQKKTSSKRNLKVFLVVHPDLWIDDEGKKWNL